MFKKCIALLLFFIAINTYSQAIYEIFNSTKLERDCQLKIQLPRNYNPESKDVYPLIVVLDGDYLFEPITGNVDYHSYWEDMPQCIVVGINQSETRESDLLYDSETYFPAHDSANFFEFIGQELLPYIEGKYNTSPFRIIAGHDLSANFVNFFLFKNTPLFSGYLVMSPDFSPEMVNRLSERLPTMEKEIFYFLSTSDNDISSLQRAIQDANTAMKAIENPKIHYYFNEFQDANHYTLVGLSIPKALNEFFMFYKPIDRKEYKEKLITYEGPPIEYLEKKYEEIENLYGLEKTVIENDLRAVAEASKERNDMESLKKLSKLAQKSYPDSMISAYYLGMYYEIDGNNKRALQYYQSGLLLKPSQFINKDMLLDKMYELQEQ